MPIILLLLLLPFTIWANAIVDQAHIYVDKSQLWKARTLYSNYLSQEKYNADYYNILLEASYIEPSLNDTIILVNKYKDKISDKKNLIDLNIYLATLYEFRGDLATAINYYDEAFLLSDASRSDLMVQKITLLLDMGDITKAEQTINKIENKETLPYLVKNKLLASMVNLYAIMNSNTKIDEIISREKTFIESQGNALLVYSIYFFYLRLLPNDKQLEILKAVLSKKFANSLENMIINGKAQNYLAPTYLW